MDPTEPDVAQLTTSGRISGTPHTVEVWFAFGDQQVYVLAGGGDRSDWVRNLMISPDVVLEIGERKRQVRARVLDPASEEDASARRLLVEKYTSRGHDVDEWGTSASAIAVAWPV